MAKLSGRLLEWKLKILAKVMYIAQDWTQTLLLWTINTTCCATCLMWILLSIIWWPAMDWDPIQGVLPPHAQCFWDRFWILHDPYQDKAFIENVGVWESLSISLNVCLKNKNWSHGIKANRDIIFSFKSTLNKSSAKLIAAKHRIPP